MARKPIPPETQKNILLKSRRRCCLCFWLDGVDDVMKGQIAHLDGDNENAAEENLAFLCFDHHDDYDGTTRLAKGLRDDEVKHWRDELYKEMDYRFRTIRKRAFELTIRQFRWIGVRDQFTAEFRLKNAGEVEARSVTVSIRLPEHAQGKVPHKPRGRFDVESFDFRGMSESIEDFFQKDGRVGMINPMPPLNSVLLAGHAIDFSGLAFRLVHFPFGSDVSLDFRVDAEGQPAIVGVVTAKVPGTIEDFAPED